MLKNIQHSFFFYNQPLFYMDTIGAFTLVGVQPRYTRISAVPHGHQANIFNYPHYENFISL